MMIHINCIEQKSFSKTLKIGDMMRFRRLKKGWFITKLAGLLLTTFYAIFIPVMILLFHLLNYSELNQFGYIVTFFLCLFGWMFISLAIVFKVAKVFDELYDFKKIRKNLEEG